MAGVTPAQLASIAFNQLGEYTNSPGHRAYCSESESENKNLSVHNSHINPSMIKVYLLKIFE